MKSLDADKKSAKSENSTSTAAPEKEEVIDFSKVKVEPLFEEFVDFDTFSKSDFRAVKVKACEAVKKSKKLLQFTLDDGCRTDFADIQNKKECGGNRQWQNHYLRNWAANTKGKGII